MAVQVQRLAREFRSSGLRGAAMYVARTLMVHAAPHGPEQEFIQWLQFANPGMTRPGNLLAFDYAAAHLPTDSPVLEIGSFCGLSTNFIAYYLRKHGRGNSIFTCDKWQFEFADEDGCLPTTDIRFNEYRTFVKESFMRNVRFFSGDNLPRAIEMLSDEFFDAWKARGTVEDVFGRETTLGGNFSFCFIDGNHTYQYARRDFEHCDEHLDAGGFLLFDDSTDGSGVGAARVAQEVRRSGRYELIMRNPNYLFRKK
jgi:predicted O-methyltransferase YrrM